MGVARGWVFYHFPRPSNEAPLFPVAVLTFYLLFRTAANNIQMARVVSPKEPERLSRRGLTLLVPFTNPLYPS